MPLQRSLSRRAALRIVAGAVLAGRPWDARADGGPADFAAALQQARGQTVYFNAWGGDPRINDYILWAAGELEHRHGVLLRQVKLKDTAEAVSRVLTEKTAGRLDGGSVDLIWINGENFAAMKAGRL